jgi:hypothetical protein
MRFLGLLGIFISLSAVGTTYTERFENCYRACNDSFFESSRRDGAVTPEDEDLLRYILDSTLQRSLSETSLVCVDTEFELMADALCFFAENGICEVGHDHPRPADLPPFIPSTPDEDPRASAVDLENLMKQLLEIIANRKLSEECLEAFFV